MGAVGLGAVCLLAMSEVTVYPHSSLESRCNTQMTLDGRTTYVLWGLGPRLDTTLDGRSNSVHDTDTGHALC